MRKKLIKPDAAFLDELRRLTDANNHTQVYYEIAAWCQDNTFNVKTHDDYVWFCMFKRIFKDMMDAQRSCDNFPYGDLRYAVGREMDERIIKVFGKACLDAINAAC